MLSLLLPYLIVLALAWPLVIFIHELSHYVMAKISGYEVTEFKPWPHRKDNIFYFGRVAYLYPVELPEVTKYKNQILISSAPLWTSFILASVWFGISLFTWLPLAAVGIAHTVDASWWWIHLALGDAHSDGRKWLTAWTELKKL